MGISTICTTHKFLPKEPQVYFFQRTMRTTTIVLASALVVIGTIMHAEPTVACGLSYADYEYYEERYSRICCGIRCSVIKNRQNGELDLDEDFQRCCEGACNRLDRYRRRRERERELEARRRIRDRWVGPRPRH